ncbi:unnamed protein product (macronuclear) [Paramecium tetraurelia]|uniref:Uncharacterized protein n=1 Tax=Paramecium tetraurelia TaxID=5888 RepID=A0DUQ1_PARTE|nr:uncharacterized protein GSPATT00020440001 [Paramecium tetraurelia]CAK86768.1 unnamed protein product [Paramecium tetraurelia]|eukprot:XP_001454165.1 hypothetical protein (macronuclear) [Paramecium tetraurelia strain d4-2]
MQFLQKLIAIPKNVLLSLKQFQQKKQQIQIVEPIKLSEDCKIETFEIVEEHRVRKRKQQTDKQIQTDLVYERTIQNSNQKQRGKMDNSKSSKQLKKIQKYTEKQSQSLSEASDKTKPSQYSYCQSNFLHSFELDEQQAILENVESLYPAKSKSVQQTHQQLFNNYLHKLKLKLDDKELLIMKQNTDNINL